MNQNVKNTKITNVQPIYSKKIAYLLRKQGFKIIGLDVNPKQPQYDVYLFENSVQLQEALTKILMNQ